MLLVLVSKWPCKVFTSVSHGGINHVLERKTKGFRGKTLELTSHMPEHIISLQSRGYAVCTIGITRRKRHGHGVPNVVVLSELGGSCSL